MTEFRDILRKGLSDLAGRCDHAVSIDNVGFSSATASKGHELASLPDRFWNDRIEEPAAYVVLHHRKQLLDRNEIDPLDAARIENAFPPAKGLSTIPSEWISFDFDAGEFVASIAEQSDRKKARQVPGAFQPAGKGRIWRIPKDYGFLFSLMQSVYDADPATREMLDAAVASADPDLVASISDRRITFDAADRRFMLWFPFDSELNDLCRPEFRWNGKCLAAADTDGSRSKIATLVGQHAFHLPKEIAAMIASVPALSEEAAGPAKRTPRMRVEFLDWKGIFEISFPYVEDWVAAVKSLPKDTRSWDGNDKSWTVRAVVIDDLREKLSQCAAPPSMEDLEQLVVSKADARPAFG